MHGGAGEMEMNISHMIFPISMGKEMKGGLPKFRLGKQHGLKTSMTSLSYLLKTKMQLHVVSLLFHSVLQSTSSYWKQPCFQHR